MSQCNNLCSQLTHTAEELDWEDDLYFLASVVCLSLATMSDFVAYSVI